MVMLDPSAQSILRAIFGMGFLSFAMWVWMSVTRLPAMHRLGLPLKEAAFVVELRARLPLSAVRVSDNYNHLFETPTLFYAVALAVVVAGIADPLQAACAWGFVAIRVLHSFVHATINFVPLRAALFTLSWLALATMIVRGIIAIQVGS